MIVSGIKSVIARRVAQTIAHWPLMLCCSTAAFNRVMLPGRVLLLISDRQQTRHPIVAHRWLQMPLVCLQQHCVFLSSQLQQV